MSQRTKGKKEQRDWKTGEPRRREKWGDNENEGEESAREWEKKTGGQRRGEKEGDHEKEEE